MKILESILILIFSIAVLLILVNLIFLKFPKEEEREITANSKEYFLRKIIELYEKCKEKYRNKNVRETCYIIHYKGKTEIKKEEVKINVEFDILLPNESVEILYDYGNVKILKFSSLVN
jgi:ribosomal protein L32E